jgi:hypothetical protein
MLKGSAYDTAKPPLYVIVAQRLTLYVISQLKE